MNIQIVNLKKGERPEFELPFLAPPSDAQVSIAMNSFDALYRLNKPDEDYIVIPMFDAHYHNHEEMLGKFIMKLNNLNDTTEYNIKEIILVFNYNKTQFGLAGY